MSNNSSRGSRTLRRRPERKQQLHHGSGGGGGGGGSSSSGSSCSDRKVRSLQSLQERLCFTLKRPRTSRARPLKGGPNSSSSHHGGKSSLMENGLIQIPHCHCDYYYYDSPATLSLSSSLENAPSSSSPSSSITQVGFASSPISSLENSSDDGFSSDEFMSLVGCSDFTQENVLDFMPSTAVDRRSCPPDPSETKATSGNGPPLSDDNCPDGCEKGDTATVDPIKEEGSSSCAEDDGEPYRIDLCDFEPDMGGASNCANEQQVEEGSEDQRKCYRGQVLCLRLDYEEVMRAWKERGEFFIAKEPSNYPSPYLDPLHTFSNATFVPHPPYCF